MGRTISMDLLGKEEQVENEKKSSYGPRDKRIFQFQPTVDRAIYVSKVYLALFRPQKFEMFKSVYPVDYWDFKQSLKVHYIKAAGDGGEVTTHMVLCQPSFNSYLVDILGLDPHFSKDCPYCIESQKAWDQYNARRKEKGLTKDMPEEKYKAAVNADELLVKYKKEAQEYGAKERHVLEVIDWQKVNGEKEVPEGEYIEFQVAFAPSDVNKKLRFKAKDVGVQFWNIEDPKIVLISRDTMSGVLASKYNVDIWTGKPEVSKELREYIEDEGSIVDTSEFIEVWDARTMIERSGLDAERISARRQEEREEDVPVEQESQPEQVVEEETESAAKEEAPKAGKVLIGRPKEKQKIPEPASERAVGIRPKVPVGNQAVSGMPKKGVSVPSSPSGKDSGTVSVGPKKKVIKW